MAENSFTQLIDVAQVQQLLELHCRTSNIAYGLLDYSGEEIVSAGWQAICVDFHQCHPITSAHCKASSESIKSQLNKAPFTFTEYYCPNGMIDIAMPILIDGECVAIFFAGQFFYDDSPPSREFFVQQAETFGFDKAGYLAALDQVPMLSREYVRNTMLFLCTMMQTIAETGLQKLHFFREIERRKAIQAQLADEQLLLRTLLQTLPDPVWLKDTTGKFLLCNAAFGLLFDDTPENIVGRRDNDYVCDELANFFQQKDQAAIAAGQPSTNEEWLTYASDGRHVLWETTKAPVCDARGETVGVLGIARDITKHRLLEEELRTKERYQQALLDNFPFMVWLKDTNSCFLSVNRTFLETAGLAADFPYHGKTDLDLFPAELAQQYRADDREILESRLQKSVEERVSLVGQLRWYETYKTPVLDKAGNLLGTVGFARDITERKQIERDLRESEQLFRSLTENSPDNIVRYDLECRIVYFNPMLVKSIVMDPEATLGKTPVELGAGGQEFATLYERNIRQVLETGQRMEMEISVLDRSGQPRTHQIRFVAERDADGKIIGALAIGSDITERRQAEKKLQQKKQKLAEVELELALAEERERHRIASVLHDHIGQILLLAKMKLDTILASNQFSTQTIEQARNLVSQSVQGVRSLTVELSPPALAEIGLEAALVRLSKQIEEEYGLCVEFSDDGLPKPLPQESCTVLYQAVRELLINIVKHAKICRAQLTISTKHDAIIVVVCDEGVGFALEDLTDALRLKKSYGLFSTLRRISNLGGEMIIDAEHGRGTLITIHMPLVNSEEPR